MFAEKSTRRYLLNWLDNSVQTSSLGESGNHASKSEDTDDPSGYLPIRVN